MGKNMSDLISRQDAIDAIRGEIEINGYSHVVDVLEQMPSAQPEVKEIGYAECTNAMLKMWINNVLTDGEYNCIMDRLNAHHNAVRRRAESEEV